MSRVARAFGSALALSVLTAPLSAQYSMQNRLRRDLVGCYALFLPGGKRVDSTFYNASPLVHLDSLSIPAHAEFSPPTGFRQAARLDTNGRPQRPTAHNHGFGPQWWADSLSDSLRLSFSNGFSGAFLTLVRSRPGSDTLHGWIEEHWDFGPPTTHGPAYAVRVACVQ